MKVTALIVSHNGARWLPVVLDGLRQATLLPDRIVTIDTGSRDESPALLKRALGVDPVRLPPETTYAAAVAAGLEAAGPAEADEWVWLLHDDSTPDARCLAFLEQAAHQARPDVAILGPKIREWPSLKRLLEVGVTLSGTGRRETGLERGEYDQGQHDQQQDVLAVNTAGMLVRRELLEELGLDPELALFGNDLDFGWRAARAGHSCQIVPDAVIFHAEAARQGLRQSALARRPRRQERAGALYTLLANAPAGTLPFRVLRMLVGGLLRTLGLLLVRAPGEAADEVLALIGVLGRPRRILRARRSRRHTQNVSHAEVRPLLAPFWLPFRHGLDFVTDVGVAVAGVSRDAAARRRPDGVLDDTPWWLRMLRRPVTWILLGALLLALVAGRNLLTGGALQGGALLPAPTGAGHWWQVWAASWHSLGTGTDAAGPAYLLPLAMLATVFLGHPGFVVTALFVLAVPLALVGALRFLRRVADGHWAPMWGASTYALLVVLGGAVQQGRLGTVAAAVLLPWVATAALGLVEGGPGRDDRRWRAAWRTALGVGLLIAFVPLAWLLVLLLVLMASASRTGRALGRQLLVILLFPLVLVLPWAIATGSVPGAWLVEAGKAAAIATGPDAWQLLLGRAGGPGAAPLWLGVGLPLAALVALLRADTRAAVLRAWMVVAATAVLLAMVSRVSVTLPGVPADFRVWLGFLVLVLQSGFVVASTMAAGGLTRVVGAMSFSWRQPVLAVAFGCALLTPVLGAGWWVGHGDDGPVHTATSSVVPAYMTDLAHGKDTGAVLVLHSDAPGGGIGYEVLRAGVLRLGDDAVLALTEPDQRVRTLIEHLLAASQPSDADRLASYGVRYVYATAPVNGVISGALDASTGFAGASAPEPGSRAWMVQAEPAIASLDKDPNDWQPVWLAAQVLAVVVGIVLALPERRRSR